MNQWATFIAEHWFVFTLLAAVGVALVVAGYCAYVALSPPGREETVDEDGHPQPSPGPTAAPMERLRLAWDSEALADWPVAEVLALMSDHAYLAPVDAEPRYRDLGFERFTAVVEGSMIGYVVCGDDVAVIVFRGTNSGELSDWFVNLDCLSIDTPRGAFHRASSTPISP